MSLACTEEISLFALILKMTFLQFNALLLKAHEDIRLLNQNSIRHAILRVPKPEGMKIATISRMRAPVD